MRTGRSPKVFYKDDFSTFNGQFEVAAAYERYGIQCKNTLPSPAFRSFMQILMGTVSSNY